MKKLYENIEDFNIDDETMFPPLLEDIDDIVNYIASVIDYEANILNKYSVESNDIETFLPSFMAYRNIVFTFCSQINIMQIQIAKFANKVYQYEGYNYNIPEPDLFDINKHQIDPNNAKDIDDTKDEEWVSSFFNKCLYSIKNAINNLEYVCNMAGNTWHDSQYIDFATAMNEIIGNYIDSSNKIIQDYNTSKENNQGSRKV